MPEAKHRGKLGWEGEGAKEKAMKRRKEERLRWEREGEGTSVQERSWKAVRVYTCEGCWGINR